MLSVNKPQKAKMVVFSTQSRPNRWASRNRNDGCCSVLKAAIVISGCVLILKTFSSDDHGGDSVFRSLDAVGVLQAVENSGTEMIQSIYEATQGVADTGTSASTVNYENGYPLGIPLGEAQALPSVLDEVPVERGIYGGKGDKVHLGGFTAYDGEGVSTTLWKHLVSHYGIKSLMDVGCGKGVSTLWFETHGVDVLCVEGSHDAVQQTLLPHPETQVVEHDYSRGPYWPAKTYDAVWSVEFLEHVSRNFQYNYIQTFRKSAVIFASHSQWGGWHHTEVHDDEWWINKFESFGFKYSEGLTQQVRKIARKESSARNVIGPDGKPSNAQHIWLNMQVFVNPVVASLPQHAHLFAEHGCYEGRGDGGAILHKECGEGRGGHKESKLPASYYPLDMTPEQDEAWLRIVRQSIAEAK